MYYDLSDDIDYPERWYLGEVKGIDNWLFRSKKDVLFANRSYQVELVKDGTETDFTLTGAFGVPIVSQRVRDQLIDTSSIKFIPVDIINKEVSKQYYIMIILSHIDCIDEKLSEFEKFEESDPVRPDKAGQYKGFFKMVIDKNKVRGESVFRIENFGVAIIISEKIKNELTQINVTGCDFAPV